MWSDNETRIDLLGFDYLVDALELVITNPSILPVTVGIAGDWGSGKTSLMRMAQDRLSPSEDVVTVAFSPWRFEGYDDMKAALMAAVIRAITERATQDEPLRQRVGDRLKRLARTIGLVRVAPIVATAAATAGEAPPEVAATAGEVAGALTEAATAPRPEPEPIESISEFREEFDRLMDELGDDVSTVLVFVDDLDRCLPETIIDTFEAIRLFLHVRKTAYVIAAHPRIVEAAIDSRYEANRRGDENLGRDYLEKILQVVITIPALAEPEVESFINLLFAEKHLEREELDLLREEARRRRSDDQLGVVMNYGIAQEVLGAPQAELDRDFSLASRIAPILARGLRGNPRQIKRFLNTLTLRLDTAKRRGVELDPAVLAKLMVLELDLTAFERLFRWQLAQDGRPSQLAEAEAATAAGTLDSLKDELGAWAAKPNVAEWLALEPPLAPVALGRYFFFSRDRLSPAAPAARLSAPLQDLLARLLVAPDALRRQGVTAAGELAPEQLSILFEVLLERAVRDPSGSAMESAMELAAAHTQLSSAFVAGLESVPTTSIPPALPPKLALLFKNDRGSLNPLFDRWEAAGGKALAAAVRSARGRNA